MLVQSNVMLRAREHVSSLFGLWQEKYPGERNLFPLSVSFLYIASAPSQTSPLHPDFFYFFLQFHFLRILQCSQSQTRNRSRISFSLCEHWEAYKDHTDVHSHTLASLNQLAHVVNVSWGHAPTCMYTHFISDRICGRESSGNLCLLGPCSRGSVQLLKPARNLSFRNWRIR